VTLRRRRRMVSMAQCPDLARPLWTAPRRALPGSRSRRQLRSTVALLGGAISISFGLLYRHLWREPPPSHQRTVRVADGVKAVNRAPEPNSSLQRSRMISGPLLMCSGLAFLIPGIVLRLMGE
jgi:hypothetical protein